MFSSLSRFTSAVYGYLPSSSQFKPAPQSELKNSDQVEDDGFVIVNSPNKTTHALVAKDNPNCPLTEISAKTKKITFHMSHPLETTQGPIYILTVTCGKINYKIQVTCNSLEVERLFLTNIDAFHTQPKLLFSLAYFLTNRFNTSKNHFHTININMNYKKCLLAHMQNSTSSFFSIPISNPLIAFAPIKPLEQLKLQKSMDDCFPQFPTAGNTDSKIQYTPLATIPEMIVVEEESEAPEMLAKLNDRLKNFYTGRVKPTTGFLPEIFFRNYLQAINTNSAEDTQDLINYMSFISRNNFNQIKNSLFHVANKLKLDPAIHNILNRYR